MVMLRSPGEATKIATKVLGKEGVKVRKAKDKEKFKLKGPYLQH